MMAKAKLLDNYQRRYILFVKKWPIAVLPDFEIVGNPY